MVSKTSQAQVSKASDKSIRLYLKEISKIPLLTVEEERELGRRIQQGDKAALQRMIESNLRFVIKIAKKYRKSGLPFLELINQGNVGLIEAAQRFDPDRNVRFTSYAVWWIRQSILFYLSQASHIYRISPKTANTLYRVSHALSKRRLQMEDMPDQETLAREVGVSVNELNSSLAAVAGTLSLDQPLDDSGELFLGDTMVQTVIESAEEKVTKNQLRDSVVRSLDHLNPMEAQVLRLRFGLEDDQPLTLSEIGKRVSLSRERIRQIEAQALSKLRSSSHVDTLATFLN